MPAYTNGSPVTLTLSNVTETASVDLALTRKALQPNLTLRKLTVADEYFLPGNIITLGATLENTGDRAVLLGDRRVEGHGQRRMRRPAYFSPSRRRVRR